MSRKIIISRRGGGFVIAKQHADNKQVNNLHIEKLVSDALKDKYVLQAVNNATDTRKINPRMREVDPDPRVYTLLLASKIKGHKS